jgi:ribonuclease HI
MYVVINAFFFIAKYREITKIDLCSDNVSLTKGITVLDAVLWIDISWKETKDSTIIRYVVINAFFFIAKYREIVNVYVFKTSRLFGFSKFEV